MPPRDPSSAGRLHIHHRQMRGQRWCMVGSPGPRIARPLATERTRSSWRVCEPATLHCWKPTLISSTTRQTPCAPFAKRSRRRSNTGHGGAPGSMQQGKSYLEVLLHPSRSLPPTLKGCWRSQGSPSGKPLALKPQQQQQQQQQQQIYTRTHKRNTVRLTPEPRSFPSYWKCLHCLKGVAWLCTIFVKSISLSLPRTEIEWDNRLRVQNVSFSPTCSCFRVSFRCECRAFE